MNNNQAGILQAPLGHSRYLSFHLEAGDNMQEQAKSGLLKLLDITDGDRVVVGIGQSLLQAIDVSISGMRVFPAMTGAGFEVPSTPAALWCWLRGEDRGELYHLGREIEQRLFPEFNLGQVLDGFIYGPSLDLTGYEDGTENPKDDDAVSAAIISNQGKGMDGSSFVAVQQWVHDLTLFEDHSQQEQDHIIGRQKSDNKEIDDAPASAHVKRTAQESFEPEAFILRRSMPWAEGTEAGLIFVAFGKSLDAYEVLLKHMVGVDDGIVDALFRFTRPVTGAYYWCPPMRGKKLDLSMLNL